MTNFKIEIVSKKKDALNYFLKLMLKPLIKLKNIPETLSFSRKKTQIKKLTILKSPHVNKKAQAQFQFVIYTNRIKYFAWENKKSIILFKKIKNNGFPDIRIKIEKILNNIKVVRLSFKRYRSLNFPALKQLKPSKLFNKNFFIYNQKLLKKTLVCLKNLDNYGITSR